LRCMPPAATDAGDRKIARGEAQVFSLFSGHAHVIALPLCQAVTFEGAARMPDALWGRGHAHAERRWRRRRCGRWCKGGVSRPPATPNQIVTLAASIPRGVLMARRFRRQPIEGATSTRHKTERTTAIVTNMSP